MRTLQNKQRRKSLNFLGIKKINFPRIGSNASKNFFETILQINSFFIFVVDLVGKIDGIYKSIKNIVTLKDGWELTYQDKETGEYRSLVPPQNVASEELKIQRQYLMEITCVRLVEAYLNYLSSLLYEIFIQRPETMKSSEKVDIETILSQASYQDIIKKIAEKKISNLSYDSFNDICHYFYDKFKLKVCDDKKIKAIILTIEMRNISVHNRCIIDERFIKHTGRFAEKKGQSLEIGIKQVAEIAEILIASVKLLDASACKKIKLKKKRYRFS